MGREAWQSARRYYIQAVRWSAATLARWIDGLSGKVGAAVSWLTTALVLLVCFDVFTRYVLNESQVWVQELEWHLFALIFLLGAAYTLRHDRHVRVDVVYSRLGRKGKAWVDLLGSLLFLVPFCGFVIFVSLDWVGMSFADRESSDNPGGLPARYILKACVPLAFSLLLLQGLALALRSLLGLLGSKGEEVRKD